jgi:hypothetical protein
MVMSAPFPHKTILRRSGFIPALRTGSGTSFEEKSKGGDAARSARISATGS